MRWPWAVAVLLVGCGGTEGSGTDADAGGDAGSDVQLEAGPCEPAGDWTFTFSTDAGSPDVEQVKLQAAPDGGSGAFEVTFLERQVPEDSCMPPPDGGTDGGADAGPELVKTMGTLDATSCKLTLGYSYSWCASGEQQYDSWAMAVTFSGNTGSGSATRISGWSMAKHTAEYLLTATKP